MYRTHRVHPCAARHLKLRPATVSDTVACDLLPRRTIVRHISNGLGGLDLLFCDDSDFIASLIMKQKRLTEVSLFLS